MNKLQRFIPLAVCLLLAVVLAAGLNAQELRGKIQGIVSDSSQAVIVGATVTLINDETGVTVTRQTGTSGNYLFDFVSPGAYSMSVELEGFRTFVQQNILMETLSDVTVDVAMEVGAVTETVTVEESPVSVQFNTTSMGTTLDRKMSTSLPLISRNPFRLLILDPQVAPTGNTGATAPFYSFAANQMDAGGDTGNNNEILVDGVPNTWGMKNNYTPPMDAVAEVNVRQNATDAEYGHSAGGTISVQLNSGTNDHHGTAYYFGRNPAINATADFLSGTPASTKHNTWGVTSGNPIVKNKLFNYFSYEWQDLRDPSSTALTMPTSLERQGDFSQSLNPKGGVQTIFDPWTTRFDPDSGDVVRTPFAGNVVPSSRMDPVSRNYLQSIWEPNRAGDNITGVNNFRLTYPNVIRYWNLSNRVDWNVSETWKVFGRVSMFRTTQEDSDITGNRSPAQNVNGSDRRGWQVSSDAVWTINPTTVFNIRGGFNLPVDNYESAQVRIGPEDMYDLWNGNKWYQPYAEREAKIYYPGVNVGGSQFGRDRYWYGQPKHWNLHAKVSKQMGRHYIKVGAEYRGIDMYQGFFTPIGFRFDSAHTADTFINPDTKNTGDAWATMLLGVLNNNTVVQTRPLNRGQNWFMSFYVHDDFKINRKLTLNLGLRYEYDSPIGDAEDRLSRHLDLTDPIPEFQGANAPLMPGDVTALRTSAPIYNGAWLFTTPEHRKSYNAPAFGFLPRIGMAYRINDKTAIRAGYARYGIPNTINDRGGINILNRVPYPGYDIISNPLPVLEGVPQTTFADPFPASVNPLTLPVEKTLGRYTNLGSTQQALWSFQNLKYAYNDRINVSLQRELPGRFVVDVTYFTSIGTNHYYQRDLNLWDPRIQYENGAVVNKSVNNPFYNILTPDKFPGAMRNQKKVKVSDLLSPYPQYRRLTEQSTPGLRRRYQALQIKLQRQFANGFNLLGGYAYNQHRADEFFDDIAQFDQNLQLQDQADARHKFNVAGIYDLPFGRGRPYMTDAHKVVEAVFGGWTMSGIVMYIGGPFLRFGTMLVDGDPALPASEKNRHRMFNTEVFTRQPSFTPRSNPLQFSGVHGMGYKNLDLTLMKRVPITERLDLEIRMECYNVTHSFMGDQVNTNVQNSKFGEVTRQYQGHLGRQFQYTGRLRW